jgi:hypothetical protein
MTRPNAHIVSKLGCVLIQMRKLAPAAAYRLNVACPTGGKSNGCRLDRSEVALLSEQRVPANFGFFHYLIQPLPPLLEMGDSSGGVVGQTIIVAGQA